MNMFGKLRFRLGTKWWPLKEKGKVVTMRYVPACKKEAFTPTPYGTFPIPAYVPARWVVVVQVAGQVGEGEVAEWKYKGLQEGDVVDVTYSICLFSGRITVEYIDRP